MGNNKTIKEKVELFKNVNDDIENFVISRLNELIKKWVREGVYYENQRIVYSSWGVGLNNNIIIYYQVRYDGMSGINTKSVSIDLDKYNRAEKINNIIHE